MNKLPLLLLSGGLDSTFLLWRTLQEGPCDVLYSDGGQSGVKLEAELKAREKIIAYCNQYAPHKVQQDLTTGYSYSFAGTPDLRYCQPMSWINAALAVVDASRHSELLIGYVYDDGGFCRWLPEIEKIWESAQKITKWSDPIPVKWPLIDVPKVKILEHIDPELATMIWVCEMATREDDGKIKACGKCRPCKTLRATLREYREENGHDFGTKLLHVRMARASQETTTTTRRTIEHAAVRRVNAVYTRHVPGVYVPRAGGSNKKEEDTSDFNFKAVLDSLT